MKQELLDYIRRPIPKDVGIVPRSVPIVFFGDIEEAEYATLAINPSNNEFTDKNNVLLPIGKKRLVDRTILRVGDDDELSIEQAQEVYESLRSYFHEDPYWDWFGHLRNFFAKTKVSYEKGSLVNLDITPWATSKKWDKDRLGDRQKKELVRHGGDLIRKILDAGQIRYLFVNGKTAIEHVEKHITKTKLTLHSTIQLEKKSCQIKVGKMGNLTIIGWSNYLQRYVSSEMQRAIRNKVFEIAPEIVTSE